MAENHLLLFHLEDSALSIPVSQVRRVLPMVEWTRLPDAPPSVLGVVNVGGVLAPVVDTRRLFGLPTREPRLSDRLIFIETAHRPLLLPVDSVAGLVPWDRARTRSPDLLRGRSAVLGLMETGDGLLVIQDVEALLEDKEGPAVDLALAHASASVEGEG